MNIDEKYAKLKEIIAEAGSLVVAFSGGVDSTLLLFTAKGVLGDKCAAVTAQSLSFPKRELDAAGDFCAEHGIKHFIVQSEELAIEGFAQNPTNRCYMCKSELFTKIKAVAAENGFNCVAEGSNLDDDGDYRPGLQAVKELGVLSPLRGANLAKAEIRALSKQLGLKTWNKQSFACLASRFPYGAEITAEKLAKLDLAEQFLIDKGFRQLRVRIHGNLARIELDADGFALMGDKALRGAISEYFKGLGFDYTSIDILGYRTGSMNETLKKGEK